MPPLAGLPYQVYPEVLDERPDVPSPVTTADGVELITAYFDEQGVYTLIPVTVENGASRNYREGHRGKGNQLYVDGGDFPALDRTGLHAEAEIDAARTITGRPIADITADARPQALSFAGFLAEDEDIISVLKGDNRLVATMGLTHPEAQEEAYLAARYARLGAVGIDELVNRLSYVHAGEMVPFYIMRYGFYEGHTRYRADPIAIAFIFGLRSLEDLDIACGGDLSAVLTTHFNPTTVVGGPADAAPDQYTLESLLRAPGIGKR